MFAEKQIKPVGLEDRAVSKFLPVQLPIGPKEEVIESADETPTRYMPVCETVTEPFGFNIEGCKHSTEAIVITLDGANHVFDSIDSKSGSAIHSVCADCHTRPDEFIGVTKDRPRRFGNYLLDPQNPQHIPFMLGSPCGSYYANEDGSIEVPRGSLPSTIGLKEAQPTNDKTIQVLRSRRKEYRRRTGMLGELLLQQTHMRLTEAEQDAVRLALSNGKRRRLGN